MKKVKEPLLLSDGLSNVQNGQYSSSKSKYVLWDKEVKVHGSFTNSGKFLTVHEFMTHSTYEAYDKNECVRVV